MPAERLGDAACPRDIEISFRTRTWLQVDCGQGWRCTVDGARDAAACGRCRAIVAVGDDVSDAVLEAALYKGAGTKAGHRRSPEPDWAQVHRELKRKHMTLQILWDEYISRYPDGYRYVGIVTFTAVGQ
jgi:hypothetical protein